jgi:hypothetical protein
LLVCFRRSRFKAKLLLEKLRTWKEAYVVGDSLNRNQWESGFAWFNLVSLWQRRAWAILALYLFSGSRYLSLSTSLRFLSLD